MPQTSAIDPGPPGLRDAENFPVHVCIIAWPQTNRAAQGIAASLSAHADQLTVAYSTSDGEPLGGAGDWVQVPDTSFYGPKHEAGLRRHRGGVLLQIQADASCADWPALLARCRHVHRQHEVVGIWSADVTHSPYVTGDVVLMRTTDPHLHAVSLTDAIVWSLAPQVVSRLLMFDYQGNNYGWGIDVAAAAFGYSRGLVSVRDTSLHVHHPASRGYPAQAAHAQMREFLQQLSLPEAALARLLRDHHDLRARNRAPEVPRARPVQDERVAS